VAELRALAHGVLALALFGIVGLSSSASIWHPAHAAASVPAGALHALTLAGGVALVVALLLIWIEAPTTSRRHRKSRMLSGAELDELGESFWTAGRTVAVVLLALTVVCIVSLPLLTRARAPSQGLLGTHPAASRAPSPTKEQGPGHSLDLGWLVLPAAVALAVLTPAAVLIRRRQRRRDQALDAEEPVELRAVRASIAALESERDPQRAILRAYARMEQAFDEMRFEEAASLRDLLSTVEEIEE